MDHDNEHSDTAAADQDALKEAEQLVSSSSEHELTDSSDASVASDDGSESSSDNQNDTKSDDDTSSESTGASSDDNAKDDSSSFAGEVESEESHSELFNSDVDSTVDDSESNEEPSEPQSPAETSETTQDTTEPDISLKETSESTENAPKVPDISTISDDDTAPNPMPGAVVGAVVNGSDEDSTTLSSKPTGQVSGGAKKQSKSKKKKFLLTLVIALVVLVGGAAAFYYGYYMNPAQVWKESLSNTGLGYNKLIDYLSTQSQSHYTGYSVNGTYSLKFGDTNFSGSAQSATQGNNSTGSLKLDTGAGNLDLELRSLEVAGASQPDEYFQVNGIKAFSDTFGPDYGPKLSAYDGKWIVIDHNLLEDIASSVTQQSGGAKSTAKLTWQEVNSFLQAASRVNQTYVFTTNKATAVTKIVKTYGKENVDGHSTFHYQVGFVPANVKAYVNAMCSALSSSSLGNYLKQENVMSDFTAGCKGIADSASKIKSTDTVDVWADIHTRLLYKVRISDASIPAENYVDVGLNYTGGNTYPFFVKGYAKDKSTVSTFSVTATLNGQTNAMDFALLVNSTGAAPININASLHVVPTKAPVHVVVPTNAIPITTVLNSLGLGDYVTQLESLGTNATNGTMPTSPLNTLYNSSSTQ